MRYLLVAGQIAHRVHGDVLRVEEELGGALSDDLCGDVHVAVQDLAATRRVSWRRRAQMSPRNSHRPSEQHASFIADVTTIARIDILYGLRSLTARTRAPRTRKLKRWRTDQSQREGPGGSRWP